MDIFIGFLLLVGKGMFEQSIKNGTVCIFLLGFGSNVGKSVCLQFWVWVKYSESDFGLTWVAHLPNYQ